MSQERSEPTELRGLRTLHAKHFELPDGKRQAVIQQGQHFWDRDTQAYEEYRPVIEDDEYVPGFSKRFKGIHWSRFARGGKWRFGFEQGARVTYTPQDAANVDVTVSGSGDSATWSELWTDVDMTLTVFPEGVKEALTLRSGVKSSFVFHVECSGVTLRQAGAAVDIVDANGVAAGRMKAPTVVDAAGVAGDVTLTVEDDVLTLAADEAWLGEAGRAFPVVIDPTTVTQQDAEATAKDTYVYSGAADTNYGTDATLQIGVGREFYVAPDLSSIPAGSAVSSATLSTWRTGAGGGTIHTGTMVRCKRINSAWVETSVTWNTKPSYDGTVIESFEISDDGVDWGTPHVTTLTDLVGAWVAETYSNNGVVYQGASGQWLNLVQSSSSATAAERPKWVITYTVAPAVTCTSPNGTVGAPTAITDEVTPNLVGDYTSVTESLNMAHRQHQVYDSDNNLVWDSGKVAEVAAPGDTITVAVPAAELVYGEAYHWRWMAWDSEGGFSPWSDLGYFTCSLSAPTNLTATADPTNAEIDLAWDAHAGETLAGYNVYRAAHDSATYTKINVEGLVATNSYTDEAVGSAIEYDYKITAVSSDGYESAKTALATQHVDFTGDWLGSQAIHLLRRPMPVPPRAVSKRMTVNRHWKVQDYGNAPKELALRVRFLTLAEHDLIMAIFATAGAVISYRDYEGQALRGWLTTTLTPDTLSLAAQAGFIDLVLSEATAS